MRRRARSTRGMSCSCESPARSGLSGLVEVFGTGAVPPERRQGLFPALPKLQQGLERAFEIPALEVEQAAVEPRQHPSTGLTPLGVQAAHQVEHRLLGQSPVLELAAPERAVE